MLQLFLFLFGYVLLSNFYTNASGFEYALIAWVVALMLEEARQVCNKQFEQYL